MLIYLLRHGIAEDPRPGQRDGERALTDEGWQRLRRAAPAWQRLCETPELICHSPLRRAIETAAVLREALDHRGELRSEGQLTPEADVRLVARMLEAEQLAGCRSVALVGHEPHLGYLLGLLLTGDSRQSLPLKKGMLVAVETAGIASLHASLRFALPQKSAAALLR